MVPMGFLVVVVVGSGGSRNLQLGHWPRIKMHLQPQSVPWVRFNASRGNMDGRGFPSSFSSLFATGWKGRTGTMLDGLFHRAAGLHLQTSRNVRVRCQHLVRGAPRDPRGHRRSSGSTGGNGAEGWPASFQYATQGWGDDHLRDDGALALSQCLKGRVRASGATCLS